MNHSCFVQQNPRIKYLGGITHCKHSYLSCFNPWASGIHTTLFLFIISSHIFHGSHTRYSFKHIPECLNIGVTNIIHYISDGFSSALELFFRSFYFYALNIFCNSIACCFFKTPLKSSACEFKLVGQLFNSKFFTIVLFNKFLRLCTVSQQIMHVMIIIH